jgi:type II secretory pathway component PulM
MTETAPRAGLWRILAGSAILALLAAFAALVVPHYLRNERFQEALRQITLAAENRNTPPEILRARVAEQAARLGLRVGPDQVRVRLTQEHLEIQVRYAVTIDLPFYTADLHFHPSARN